MRSQLALALLLLSPLASAQTAPAWKAARVLQGQKPVRTQSRAVTPAELTGAALSEHQQVTQAVATWGDTPNMRVAPMQPHVTLTTLQHPAIADPPAQPNYTTAGMHGKLQLAGARAGDEVELVVVMPVSAHHGLPKDSYAQTNRYDIWIDHPDGQREQVEDVATSFVSQAHEGYATPHLLKLKLEPGSTMISFAARGSAGVGGYRNGRVVEIVTPPTN